MILTTVALAAMLAASQGPQHEAARPVQLAPATHVIAVDLHPMTDEEKRLYPGREHWDKTEWYESQFKSAKVTTAPEHVDEWHNGGVDQA